MRHRNSDAIGKLEGLPKIATMCKPEHILQVLYSQTYKLTKVLRGKKDKPLGLAHSSNF